MSVDVNSSCSQQPRRAFRTVSSDRDAPMYNGRHLAKPPPLDGDATAFPVVIVSIGSSTAQLLIRLQFNVMCSGNGRSSPHTYIRLPPSSDRTRSVRHHRPADAICQLSSMWTELDCAGLRPETYHGKRVRVFNCRSTSGHHSLPRHPPRIRRPRPHSSAFRHMKGTCSVRQHRPADVSYRGRGPRTILGDATMFSVSLVRTFVT